MKKITSIFLAFLLLFSGCATLAEEISDVIPNYDELVVGTSTPMSGNFFTSLWGDNTADMDVRTLIHGYSLVRWNSELGSFGIDPSVVSGMAVTDDAAGNRTYQLVLYEDLRYSNGEPITAADYVFSMLFSIAPQVQAIGGTAGNGDMILGSEDYQSGDSPILAGVRLLGTYQLSLTVKASYLPFFYELSALSYTPAPISEIAPGCEVADDGQGAYIKGPFTSDLLRTSVLDPESGYATHPSVTSGPYVLESYDAKAQQATFAINPFYKGNSYGEVPRLPRLIFKWVANEDAIGMLESGEIGLVNKCVKADVIAEGMAKLQQGALVVSNYARSGFAFINFSCERPTVRSAAVRKAIAQCLDKDAFVAEYVRNYGLRVDGYYGIGQWMYRMVAGSLQLQEPENATEAEMEDYERRMAILEQLSMDSVPVYNLDTEAAARLLDEDGWQLNAEGIREKVIDGETVQLRLTMLYPEGTTVGDAMQTVLVPNLASVGIALELKSMPFTQLLQVYYRQQARDCDMIYLATNFSSVFDPRRSFDPEDADVGSTNRSGLADPTLYELAKDMSATQEGDVATYCQKWLDFEVCWAEQLPAIPLYSNAYFDFYTPNLYNYNVGSSIGWADAVVAAYLSDAEETPAEEEKEEETEGEAEELGDDEVIIF